MQIANVKRPIGQVYICKFILCLNDLNNFILLASNSAVSSVVKCEVCF